MFEPGEFLQSFAPMAFRLLLAVVCGAAIGLEREKRAKPAGLRTHILICVGACLFTLVGVQLQEDSKGDAMRIVQGLILGIGFLGAGVMFTRGTSVHGVTTAAGLWVVTAIGLAIGLGYYPLAIFSTVVVFFIVAWLKRVEPTIHRDNGERGAPEDGTERNDPVEEH